MYSPKIDEELIPTLYWRAKENKVPMTRLVNGILRAALEDNTENPAGTASRAVDVDHLGD